MQHHYSTGLNIVNSPDTVYDNRCASRADIKLRTSRRTLNSTNLNRVISLFRKKIEAKIKR